MIDVFVKCEYCQTCVAVGKAQVDERFGYRTIDGVKKPIPVCKKCRDLMKNSIKYIFEQAEEIAIKSTEDLIADYAIGSRKIPGYKDINGAIVSNNVWKSKKFVENSNISEESMDRAAERALFKFQGE